MVLARDSLNPSTHRPEELETVPQLDDFWFYSGDVQRRIYFDDWRLVTLDWKVQSAASEGGGWKRGDTLTCARPG